MSEEFRWDEESRKPVDKKAKKKGRFITYVATVLTTTIISSFTVGVILYEKFSDDLKNALLSQNTIQNADSADNVYGVFDSVGKIVATGSTKVSDTSDQSANQSSGDLNLAQTALAKGSPIPEIARKVGPSIIGIRMTVSSTGNRYRLGGSQEYEGSGVIIRKDGYIMTNYHVIQYADPKSGLSANTVLEVFLPDGREAKATYVGGDSKTDLAVIKITLDNLQVAELGDSSKLEVGETAVAIGNPLGMEFAGSVTVGVISALNREIGSELLSLIQTDAAINPGNSGGALVNTQGEVIGINSAKISETGVEGLGFAIPINEAKPIIDQLILFGYVKGRPLLGISGEEITETLSRWYSLPVGIYVTEVTAGSGAEKAGIMIGDIITKFDGKAVETLQDLDSIMLQHSAGDTVSVTLVRGKTTKTLQLTFTEDK